MASGSSGLLPSTNRLFSVLRHCGARDIWFSRVIIEIDTVAQAFLDNTMLPRTGEWPNEMIVGPSWLDPELKTEFLRRLESRGVTRERIELVARTMPWADAVVQAMRITVGSRP